MAGAPAGGHPLANDGCRGLALRDSVTFAGARIDALVRCDGAVLTTRAPDATRFGVAQVRRLLTVGALRVTHVVFAPASSRALLLGLARLENAGSELVAVEYTEIWDLPSGEYRVAPAACERRFGGHVFALAEASDATRALAPEAEPARGLALDVTVALPPRAQRQLAFAYAALPDDEDTGALVRAWRGQVPDELVRIGRSAASVEAYRERRRYPAPP
ncbi:MAG TPA: hypothetical protein VMR86_07765 [Myxococcota bacterium]|nr:hypothetical protein [Myxococcota bacterium]